MKSQVETHQLLIARTNKNLVDVKRKRIYQTNEMHRRYFQISVSRKTRANPSVVPATFPVTPLKSSLLIRRNRFPIVPYTPSHSTLIYALTEQGENLQTSVLPDIDLDKELSERIHKAVASGMNRMGFTKHRGRISYFNTATISCSELAKSFVSEERRNEMILPKLRGGCI